MRSPFLSILPVLLAAAGPAYAQSPCDAYPGAKTWIADPLADPDTFRIQDPNGAYPGWNPGSSPDSIIYPDSVAGEVCQTDHKGSTSNKMYYQTSEDPTNRWDVIGGGVISVTWRVHISEISEDKQPSIKIYGSNFKLRLDYDMTVVNSECPLGGWKTGKGDITGGGRLFEADRYLLMPMNEWHTVRVDLEDFGTGHFDMWLDDGGSDWKHITGTADPGSENVLKVGVSEGRDGDYTYSTACLAWGEGTYYHPDDNPTGEVPPRPSATEEICENDNNDDDGDGDADCDDADCDCITIPGACGETTDIFERFNVNFVESQVIGQVPPGWERSHYGAPAETDRDEAASPIWYSEFDRSPGEPNQGPYYWLDPGPYIEEREAVLGECLANGYEVPGLGACPPPPDPFNEECCNTWVPRLFHYTTPVRFELDFYNIPGECGDIDDCYRGLITIEEQVKADDLAFLPIDWAQPVTITADAVATDLSPNGAGKWETFVTFEGYTGVETRVQWDSGGATSQDYTTVSYEMAPGQGSPAGPTTLLLGVDFDYVAYKGEIGGTASMSQAFFENLRITYRADMSKPLIHLDKMAINHEILRGEPLPSDAFTITNAQPRPGTTLNYTIDDDPSAAWLTTAGGDGQSSGESDVITINYETVGLAPGTYVGVITVDSPDINKSAATITVTVEVVGERLELSETEFTHTVPARTSPANDSFTVGNSGGGAMTYSIIDGDPDVPWLSEAPDAGGPLAGGESNPLTVTYDTADLPVGTHNATISVSSPEADNSPQSIAVSVTITLTPPDYDSDGDVDQDDFAIFQGCFTGELGTPTPGLCATYADLDCNGHVDQQDLLEFEACASGPDIPFLPSCYTGCPE